MRKFPSIDQFRHVVANVTHRACYIGNDAEGNPQYDHARPKPSLTFEGTVKLHGTNAGVRLDCKTGEKTPQSRERQLTLADDNHGFAAWVESDAGGLPVDTLLVAVRQYLRLVDLMAGNGAGSALAHITVYGEWCGRKVNGKTAIGALPERWVIFNILAGYEDESESWLDMRSFVTYWDSLHLPARFVAGLNFIHAFRTYSLTVDFNHPEASLAEMERLTLEVEAECPVARALGALGMGEGIVWSCQSKVYGRQGFKTKGVKHKGTRNSRLVDIAPEVLAGRQAFVDAVLTESRLEQGFSELAARVGKVTEEHIGEYLMWVGQDVLKEESDTLAASGLEKKDVMKSVNRQAKEWLLPRLARI